MTKTKQFFENLFKPFSHNSNREGLEVDLENITAQEQKQFSFEILVRATKNFHTDHKLGQGGFGPVYKGKLVDGREIAVKRLSLGSAQGNKEFMNEAKLLARVQHRNVVNLLGYCVQGTERLLVYEYVANESLDKHLFKFVGHSTLDWKRRYDIICGIARGLLYLHEDSHIRIIHRDIKGSNILLDDKWVPKIADFGMARLFPEGQTHVNTRIAGTNGYMAPEYVMHGRLSAKADVFSFGVVVLELISGQKNSTFDLDPDSRNLLDWAYKQYKKGNSLDIIDAKLVSSVVPDQVSMCIQMGLLCTQAESELRPSMHEVVIMLSKKTSILKEPTRPGYPGARYRRSNRSTTTHSTSSVRTCSLNSHSSGSTTHTNTDTAKTASSSTLKSPIVDRGKRPMYD